MSENYQHWQRQLLHEHERICRYYRVKLPTPMLDIGEGLSRAGSWRPVPPPGVLQIAGWLIREHGWEVVLEVLKHEMSHQYVDLVLGRGQEPPHGPAFQEACRRLGVHPRFRRAQSDISHLLAAERDTGTNALPVLGKIEKLLALAGSANEHEAALAMEKAGDLMRRHNLERLAHRPAPRQSAGAGNCDYLVINTGRRRLPSHHLYLTALLQDFFYVKTISYWLYSPRQRRHHRAVELLGSRENLAVAEYVYHFLGAQLPRLWRRHREQSGAPGREKISYYIGVLNGFADKLRRREAQSGDRHRAASLASAGLNRGATCSSLVCAEDPELHRFLHDRYPRLRTVRGKGRGLFADSYRAGQAEGNRLVIHKGLNHRQGNRGRLLG